MPNHELADTDHAGDIPVAEHAEREEAFGAIGYLRRSRSVRLIELVLATGALSVDELAAALKVTPHTLALNRCGHSRMALVSQLALALLVMERWPQSPQLLRHARGLRGQALAEAAFHAHVTKTHSAPPARVWWGR